MQILEIDELAGLWCRSLIVRADGGCDTTSWVGWLQGPSDYADLRQPVDRPDFGEAGCLRQLTMAHLDWMVRQDGFAGKLLVREGIFEWRRDIDFQPTGPIPDRGSLIRDDDVMIETGYQSPYVEHWHPDWKMGTPAYALRLRDGTNGCAGQIVRVGASFMYARGRSAGLPVAANLAACIAGAGSLPEAQDMVDCEISFGSISESGWTIFRSTLPFKEGRLLGMRPLRDWNHVETLDSAADGSKTSRSWEVIAIEGNVD